jgi:small subunit ribosomal protein S4
MIRFSKPKLKIRKKLGLLSKPLNKMDINKLNLTEKENFSNIDKNIRTSISNDYKERLIEKQKLKFSFGLTETKLHNYIKLINKKKYFNKVSLIELINSRLDSIVFYLGFSKSISEAKQFISHGHILLNNKVNTIPSVLCKINSLISIKDNSKIIDMVKFNINSNKKNYKNNLKLNIDNLTGQFISPIRLENSFLNFNESKVIEYYSNK